MGSTRPTLRFSLAVQKAGLPERCPVGDMAPLSPSRATPSPTLNFSLHSIRVLRDDLAAGLGSERPPDRLGNRFLDEMHRPIREDDVHAAGMTAGGR